MSYRIKLGMHMSLANIEKDPNCGELKILPQILTSYKEWLTRNCGTYIIHGIEYPIVWKRVGYSGYRYGNYTEDDTILYRLHKPEIVIKLVNFGCFLRKFKNSGRRENVHDRIINKYNL